MLVEIYFKEELKLQPSRYLARSVRDDDVTKSFEVKTIDGPIRSFGKSIIKEIRILDF